MSGPRGLLVVIANLLLLVLVVLVPLGATLVGAYGAPLYKWGEWNWPYGFLVGSVSLLVALPTAAILATFMDIRE